jgi:hypothetical protein
MLVEEGCFLHSYFLFGFFTYELIRTYTSQFICYLPDPFELAMLFAGA